MPSNDERGRFGAGTTGCMGTGFPYAVGAVWLALKSRSGLRSFWRLLYMYCSYITLLEQHVWKLRRVKIMNFYLKRGIVY